MTRSNPTLSLRTLVFYLLVLAAPLSLEPTLAFSEPLLLTGGRFYQGDEILDLSNIEETSFSFILMGGNSYRGSTCYLDGKTQRESGEKTPLYLFKEETCSIAFTVLSTDWIRVDFRSSCASYCGNGADFEGGDYKQRKPECAKTKQIGTLSKKKKYAAAYALANQVEKSCASSMDDNTKGSLYSDLAFLAFKTGNKKACLEFVAKGIQSMHKAAEGPQALEEAKAFYQGERKKCSPQSQPGCVIYQDRIKIFKQLKYNETLCGEVKTK